MVQVLSGAELAEAESGWRRCADCPAATVKTRLEQAQVRPAPSAASVVPATAVASAKPLPRTEIRFPFKSVTFGAMERDALRIWATSWGPKAFATLRITAYAESTLASHSLCEVRAREVQAALERLGIPMTQFERVVAVVSNPSRRVAIEVTHLPGDTAASVSDSEAAGMRPASAHEIPAHPSSSNGALP